MNTQNKQTIDHTTLTKMAQAGVVRTAHIVGQEGGWGILVKCGMTEHALATQRSHQVRIFKKLETLVTYLKGVGIARFDVDAVNYKADSAATYKRPDRAIAMKSAHEAAAYDKWLKAEIQEAIDDTGPTIAHELVMNEMQGLIEMKKKQHAAKIND